MPCHDGCCVTLTGAVPAARRFRVALRDRLIDAEEHELAAQAVDGQQVTYLSPSGPVPATVIMVQDMSW